MADYKKCIMIAVVLFPFVSCSGRLIRAVKDGNLQKVKELVEGGSDVNETDDDGYTPLHWACKSGNLEIVKILVEKGANINAKDKNNHTPLHWAARKLNLEIVKYLVQKGADVYAKDNWGRHPSEFAEGVVKNYLKQMEETGEK